MLGTILIAVSSYLQSRESAPRYTGAAHGISVVMILRVARAQRAARCIGRTCKTESGRGRSVHASSLDLSPDLKAMARSSNTAAVSINDSADPNG